jgi:hypothetical protein
VPPSWANNSNLHLSYVLVEAKKGGGRGEERSSPVDVRRRRRIKGGRIKKP